VKPTFDQCADPTYTQLRANLPVWHKLRPTWHAQSVCDATCVCGGKRTDGEGVDGEGSGGEGDADREDQVNMWFRSISGSEQQLLEGLLCDPVECPELRIDTDGNATPKLYKPLCARGECNCPECLKSKLVLLRKCKTEFAASHILVRYRKYAKMNRTRNDGTEYTEV
jgi:hypothetical protein